MYHNAIVKTEEELAEMKKIRDEKKRLKDLRKKIQNENVAKKEQQKTEHKHKSMAGAEKSQDNEDDVADDDADYYRQEVGEDPDEGMSEKQPKKISNDKKKSKLLNISSTMTFIVSIHNLQDYSNRQMLAAEVGNEHSYQNT